MKKLIALVSAFLIACPLSLAWYGHSHAQVPTIPLGQQPSFTPDQINAAVNYLIKQVNQYTYGCSAAGCSEGPIVAAAPTVTGTCATAGSGAGFALANGSTNYAGSVTCASTANTQAIITWGATRGNVPNCVWSGTTGAVVTATSTASALTLNYSSVASNVLSWVCIGQ